jgi:hypothetical protein
MLGRGVGLADLVEGWLPPSGEVAEAVCRFVRAGLFDCARRLQGLTPQERDGLKRRSGWFDFLEVVVLADQIDNFLATMEADRRAAGLAGECRGELDLLLILAEFCEDHAMPRAAEQARFFHALAEGKWQEGPELVYLEVGEADEWE